MNETLLSLVSLFFKEIKELINKQPSSLSYTKRAKCGTIVTQLPFVFEVEDGYEMTKFNPETGKLYWLSDGTYSPHIEKRKIPNRDKEQV